MDAAQTGPVTPDATVARHPDIVAAPLGNELAMLGIASGRYYVLDDIGAMVWRQIETPQTFDGLLAALVSAYDVTEARCREDLLELIAELRERGIVVLG